MENREDRCVMCLKPLPKGKRFTIPVPNQPFLGRNIMARVGVHEQCVLDEIKKTAPKEDQQDIINGFYADNARTWMARKLSVNEAAKVTKGTKIEDLIRMPPQQAQNAFKRMMMGDPNPFRTTENPEACCMLCEEILGKDFVQMPFPQQPFYNSKEEIERHKVVCFGVHKKCMKSKMKEFMKLLNMDQKEADIMMAFMINESDKMRHDSGEISEEDAAYLKKKFGNIMRNEEMFRKD